MTGDALVGRKPSIWWTESKLGEALARLAYVDPEDEMSAEQGDAFIATFVQPEALRARRDEFAAFVIQAEAMLAAKRAELDALTRQAEALAHGIESMKHAAVEAMKARGVDALQGDRHVLKLRRSPGSVAVDDEAAIPERFWTVYQDQDMEALEQILHIVHEHEVGWLKSEDVCLGIEDEIAPIIEASRARRRRIDKKAIQEAWKESRETFVPGVHKEVTTKLVIQ